MEACDVGERRGVDIFADFRSACQFTEERSDYSKGLQAVGVMSFPVVDSD